MDHKTYDSLKYFIGHKMSMSHIYQPVMLMALLEGDPNGMHKRDIARAILAFDASQIDYYENIVGNMPGRVLKSHGIVESGPSGSGLYRLRLGTYLLPEERDDLLQRCQQKLDAYIEKRGASIWAHRDHGRKGVPGSIRYRVLSRAHFRCELCGISAEKRALEVDHIVPKNLGGPDTIDNYQALCYVCNANKRDTDKTDFRGWAKEYAHRKPDCLLCELADDRFEVLDENELCLTLKDNYPVSEGHCLIISKRHVETYFEMNQAEVNAANRLMHQSRKRLQAKDASISGFNTGMNSGISAGQSIFHAHIHLIPRRDGDQENPRGGIRNIFPKKAIY
jgi:diadenosine tetraphosphate (Ap4A) HIT family hydrolase